ncbi:MAG TPA: ABC transporter permease, partial [Vicinamibacterales bacterium]|nr:ABC transporter permease [Vicinamibacterales bacterium]
IGRTFHPEHEQAAPPHGEADEVVIAYDLWQRRFGGRTDVLARTVRIEGRLARRIVGVMPRGFDFPGGVQIWGPRTFRHPIAPGQRQARYYRGIARLRPGASLETARLELARISTQLAEQYQDSHAGFEMTLDPLDEATTGSVQPALLAIAGVVGCVLLIACANVTSLMLARAAARRRDFAVRSALGATMPRLLRQSFTESALLSTGGVAGGLLLAWSGTRLLIAAAPGGVPRLEQANLNGAVLAFTAVLAVLCTVITAMLPAVHVAVDDLGTSLKGAGRSTPARRRRARAVIIAAQVALTMVLLVAAAVLLRSFIRLRGVDLGFDPARVVAADLRFPTSRFAETKRPWARLGHAYDRIIEDLQSLPGIEAVGGVTGLPLTGEDSATVMWLGESPEPPPDANAQWTVPVAIVTPDYFRALRIPIVRGRAFDANDRLSERVLTDDEAPRPRGVVIINEAFARRYWPGQDPIGRSIRLSEHWAVSASAVVGVAGDVRQQAVSMPAGPAVYVPWGETPGFRLALVVRTTGDIRALAADLRTRLRSLEPQLFISNLRPLDAVVAGAIARPRFNLLLVASFALLGLALAAVGVYGVVAY